MTTEDVGAALGTGHRQPVGWFRVFFDSQRWEWSDDVAAMHGYHPEQVRPTTALLLSHKHPDDRSHVAEELTQALASKTAFSSRHRIIDTAGRVHPVAVISSALTDQDDRLVGAEGLCLDLTEFRDETLNIELGRTIYDFTTNRAVIEQAKGMIMLVYQLTDHQAFAVLSWRSQNSNVKLRDLARSLVDEAAQSIAASGCDYRREFDRILFAAR